MITLAYVLFLAICVFGLIANFSNNKDVGRVLFFVIFCALILFSGLREIGSDQDSVAYEAYYNLPDSDMAFVAEPTFVIIAQITRLISFNYGINYLFLVYAIIGVSLKLLSIRQLTSLYWLSILTYFSNYFFLHEFTQIRAAIASGLLLLSIKLAYDRKAVAFVIVIGIASLFHYSALVAFPIYFLSSRSLSFWAKVAIAMAIPLGIVFHFLEVDLIYSLPIEVVRSKIQVYLETESLRDIKLNVFNSVYLIKYALLYILLIFSNRIINYSEYFPILIKIYAISMFSYLALSANSAFSIRISELFGVVEIVLIPLLYYSVRPRSLGGAFVVLLAAGNFALGLYQTKLIQI